MGVHWHNVTFGKLAEICEKYLSKGQQAYSGDPLRFKAAGWPSCFLL